MTLNAFPAFELSVVNVVNNESRSVNALTTLKVVESPGQIGFGVADVIKLEIGFTFTF